jgi:hypothetical protein
MMRSTLKNQESSNPVCSPRSSMGRNSAMNLWTCSLRVLLYKSPQTQQESCLGLDSYLPSLMTLPKTQKRISRYNLIFSIIDQTSTSCRT